MPGNRARSNSDQGSRDASAAPVMDAAPQLGGLFAAGMPKLRKTGGGVDTGGMLDADSRQPKHLYTDTHCYSEPRRFLPIRPRVVTILSTETTRCFRPKATRWRSSGNTRPRCSQPTYTSISCWPQKDDRLAPTKFLCLYERAAPSNRQETAPSSGVPQTFQQPAILRGPSLSASSSSTIVSCAVITPRTASASAVRRSTTADSSVAITTAPAPTLSRAQRHLFDDRRAGRYPRRNSRYDLTYLSPAASTAKRALPALPRTTAAAAAVQRPTDTHTLWVRRSVHARPQCVHVDAQRRCQES